MIDTNTELLYKYFKDNNFDANTKQKLLEDNPFNEKYMKWERNFKKTNRVLAFAIKEKKLIKKDTNINEITAIGDINISRFLIMDEQDSLDFKKNTIVLARDNLYSNDSYLNSLFCKTPHFIVGICTRDYRAYKQKLAYYKEFIKKHKKGEIVESLTDGYNVCFVRK